MAQPMSMADFVASRRIPITTPEARAAAETQYKRYLDDAKVAPAPLTTKEKTTGLPVVDKLVETAKTATPEARMEALAVGERKQEGWDLSKPSPAAQRIKDEFATKPAVPVEEKPMVIPESLPVVKDLAQQAREAFPDYQTYLTKNAVKDTPQERHNYATLLESLTGKTMSGNGQTMSSGAPTPPPKEVEKAAAPVLPPDLKKTDPETGAEAVDWDKIGQIAKDTGMGVLGVLQSAISGWLAAKQGQQFDPNATVLGQYAQEKASISDRQREMQDKLAFLDATQKYQSDMAAVERAYQDAVRNETNAVNIKEAQKDRDARMREIQVQQDARLRELRMTAGMKDGVDIRDPMTIRGAK